MSTSTERTRAVNPFSQPDRLIDTSQVCHRLRVSKRTLYRHVAQGRVPAPAEKRRGMVAKWRESDVVAHIAKLTYMQV